MVNRLLSNINVSQVVWQHTRSGGIFNNQLTVNLRKNISVKKSEHRLRFHRIMGMSLWPHFFDAPCKYGLVKNYKHATFCCDKLGDTNWSFII